MEITSRTVVTLREHGEVLGSIWAVTDTPLDAARTATLAEAARSIAVRLAHYRLTAGLRSRHDEATVSLLPRGRDGAVVAGGLLAAIAATAAACGSDGPIVRCAIALKQELSMSYTARAVARVDDVFTR